MELWRLSATATAALVRTREASAREVAEAAVARMEAANPALNAVIDPMAEEALAAADRTDAALARGEDPGPLAGVPMTVKVNVDVAGHANTNGLQLQKDNIATADNPVVANLKRAGATLIGITNTPAFSLRWFTRNSLHGATRNPHDAGITPGGSSGGAAAATAAGIGAAAQGTDIAGSVRYPAYACNIHGLRPTPGRVPAANPSLPDRTMGAALTAVSGPLARRIEDVRLVLGAMAAADPRDPFHAPVPFAGPPAPRRVAFCGAPEGMTVAPEVARALEDAARALEAAGWAVEPVEATPPIGEAAALNMALWMADFGSAAAGKLAAEGDPDAAAVARMLMEIAPKDIDAMQALHRRTGIIREWSVWLEPRPLLLCPVSGEAPFADHSDQDPEAFPRIYAAQVLQVGLPVMGLPGLSVATGRPGAPMGVQLIGPRWREDLLLEAGAVIEAARPPIDPVEPFVAGAPA